MQNNNNTFFRTIWGKKLRQSSKQNCHLYRRQTLVCNKKLRPLPLKRSCVSPKNVFLTKAARGFPLFVTPAFQPVAFMRHWQGLSAIFLHSLPSDFYSTADSSAEKKKHVLKVKTQTSPPFCSFGVLSNPFTKFNSRIGWIVEWPYLG